MREKYLAELCQAMGIGGMITALIFAAIHQTFTPGEVVAFWMGIWFVSTYAVWSIIIWTQKCRDAWHCNHGKKSERS